MAMLTSYDPFAATSAALRALDQLTGRSGSSTARALSGMPMDAYRVNDQFVVHFDLPGVDPGSIDLSVEGNTLTVSAERSMPQLETAEWAVAERPFGSYTRQLVLSRSLDTDRLEASYHDGVLTLSIPVADKAKARKIPVQRADTPTAVEGRTIEGEAGKHEDVHRDKAVEA
jgi:HSP20 family protein